MTERQHLVVDRIRCDGRGLCAELLPELIRLDDWGYPILTPGSVPDHPAVAGAARGGGLSRARDRASTHPSRAMTVNVLGISDGRALGCILRVIVTRPELLKGARAAVDDVVAAIDAAASRFRDDSELCLLNASPGRAVEVSPLLAQAIEQALRGAELTEGAVDPTVGRAIRLAGYDTDFTAMAADAGPLHLVVGRIPGWKAMRFDARARTVLLPRGVELDLGATAKALASDLAATAAIEVMAGGGVLVSIGGDIAVAGEPPEGGWAIQASEDSATPLSDAEETVTITSGGLATSGTTVRRWLRGGVEMHHIIDPATGLPAETCWRTVTVAAGSCVDANIASTAAIVMGERAPEWLESRRLAARLVHREGRVLRVGGWPGPAESKPIPTNL
jgi:thiamine biosynthesis lipoprotein